jgi:murein L,D-transpeptidase YcbB/YkuD
MSNQAFINEIASGAVKAQQEYGICASLTIAQAILESGWGSSAPGNNLFGIKWTAGCGYARQVRATKEYINGRWESIDAEFRVYASLSDSVYDHACFLVNNSRYHNLLGVTNYITACNLIKQDGYATDPNYPSQLIEIIQANNLERFDNSAAPPMASMSSNTIKIIQEQLNAVTNNNLVINGELDPCTIAGIRQLQTILGAPVTGIWDVNCVNCINQVYAKPLCGFPYHQPIPTKIIQFRLGLQFTGVFDGNTENHVKARQASKGLVADGIFGTQSWNKLL